MKAGKIIAILIAAGIVAAVYLADRLPAKSAVSAQETEQTEETPASNNAQADLDAKVEEAVNIIQSGDKPPMVAIQLLREVIEADSNHIGANYWLGEFSVMSGQFEKAIPRFKNILRQQPANVEVCIKLARAYEASGQIEQGKAILQDFMVSNPGEEVKEQIEPVLKEMIVKS